MNGNTESGSKIHVVETLIGIFAVTGDNDIVERVIYPRDAKQINAALERHAAGEPSKEMSEMVEKLVHRGFETVMISNEPLADALRGAGVNVEIVEDSGPEDFVRENIESIAVDFRAVEDRTQYYALSREVSVLRTRKDVQKAQSERGATIIQTAQLLIELDKSLNVLSGKLREWYGLHFPELSRAVDDHNIYAILVERLGDRSNFSPENLGEFELGDRVKRILSASEDSMGAPLLSEDEEHLRSLAANLVSLYSYRESLEAHIMSIAEEAVPNLSVVAGPVLAAKLLEKAGGLKRLAMMPSGTVQILGAEKALFRSKKTGAKPPKHGLIFQHPYIHAKPRNLRGKAARTLAAKISLAARADAFSGNPIGAELRRQLDEESERQATE
ncbi:C/D box methylation guide ribonucleoprotein complex aNOP56 subunit [Candidatus Bathyarchaeota archaeon]|nr:C/D box methylation guide ribonucleoprotein complex aNOP56 subunit [Candidatus Bathyarchaeota archaeon]MBL7079012.1 C/D box methylation guide ribonucleoprotein complex aNOP56 subunit [Candidatus Bathyarchaeota archaeon]